MRKCAWWRRPLVVVGVAGLGLTSAGCKDDDGGGNDDATEAGDGDGDGDGDGETGTAEGDGDALEAWSFGPIYAAANLDDDDGNGQRDWLQAEFSGDDELGQLLIPANTYAPGDRIRLSLAGDVAGIRFWYEGAHVLGHGPADPLLSYEIVAPTGDLTLGYEFGAYLAYADLTLERLDGDGNVRDTTTLEAVSSPLIMNHHLQPAEHLWIIQTSDNQAYVSDYAQALGDDVTAVPGAPYQMDRWIQDEIEFAYSTTPSSGLRLDTVIDSIRDRGLDKLPEDLFSIPGWNVQTWGNPINATTFDSFGNLEASPPVPGYPFGRIYYGRIGNNGLDQVLGEFLASQTIQAPFELDTDWLCVGHVDEFSTFIPDPSAPRGFRLGFSDTVSGYALIDGLDPTWSLGRFASGHGYATIGAMVNDNALRALNQDIQANELDPLRERFKAELGLTEDEIIDIPAIFEEVSGCGGRVVSLIPGTVNLIVANLPGKTVLAVPDPFARGNGLGPADDPVAQDFEARMPEGVEVAWIDNWYSYHLQLGEVHCGTNVTRTPLEDWTTAGADLLGLQGAN
jgi:hypothetical protein